MRVTEGPLHTADGRIPGGVTEKPLHTADGGVPGGVLRTIKAAIPQETETWTEHSPVIFNHFWECKQRNFKHGKEMFVHLFLLSWWDSSQDIRASPNTHQQNNVWNVVFIYSGILLFSYSEVWNVTCRKMDGIEYYHLKFKSQILMLMFLFMQSLCGFVHMYTFICMLSWRDKNCKYFCMQNRKWTVWNTCIWIIWK